MIDKGMKGYQPAASSQAMQATYASDEPIFTFEISGTSTVKINSDQKIVRHHTLLINSGLYRLHLALV